MFYENNNNELMFVGSFIGMNYHRIKFVMYRYLKTTLKTSEPIVFGIYEVKKQKLYIYVGSSKKTRNESIEWIKSVNKVSKAPTDIDNVFRNNILDKIRKDGQIMYTKTYSYREVYDNDDIITSETDSEFDSNE